MKETLEEEEATESGVILSVASSPDDITIRVAYLVVFSNHPLPVSLRLKFAPLKKKG